MNQRFRGFATLLLLAALLAGAGLALSNDPLAVRGAALVLTIGACFAAAGVLTGRSRLMWLLAPGAALAALFLLFAPAPSPWSPRALHDAALLSYGALAVAVVLAPLPVIGEGRALLVTFSTAAVLFGADLFVQPVVAIPTVQPPEASTLSDPDLGFRFLPNSTGRQYYPDNPRGYFETRQPAVADTWSLVLQQGSTAALEHVSSGTEDVMRVTISKRVGTDNWTVSLRQTGFQVTRGTRYVMRFRARTDAPHRIACELAQNHAPWTLLGEYREVDVDTHWKDLQCAFDVTRSDTDANISFALSTSDAAIEFAGVALDNQSTGRSERPRLPSGRFFVTYRFNSLGFRGPDYAIPRPAGTFRILALGDSYAQGAGVRESDTFEAVLQDHLNRSATSRPGAMHYEVINAGISGYATRQELRSYERFSSAYDAQVVLLVMVYNDDMSYLDEERRGLVGAGRDAGGLAKLVNRTRQATRTFDYTDTIAALKDLERATQMRGAKLAVVIFTNSRFAPWDKMAAEVKAALAGTDVPMLNLKDALLGHGHHDQELQVDAFDGHPNEIAHRIAAEEIERFLASEHLLP